ncbi:MAG: ABC transporter permease [Candidatus Cloacimonetes bacterium]|nr:ABC transporter permease [Candidatus Cloacimonadota bacterium]
MIKHYLLIAWRNIVRQKTYAFLNISGLALGMACFIIIMLWVKHELSYDKHNENYKNLYLVGIDIKIGDQEGKGSTSSGSMAGPLVEDYPEVLSAARIYKGINKCVSYIEGDVHHTEGKVYYADSTIFDLFTIPILKGDPSEKLNRPRTMFITESTARKYFGDEEPIGKFLDFDGWWQYEVVGIIADAPETSHWQYDFIACHFDVNVMVNPQWLSDNLITYILLKDGTDWQEFEAKLIDFADHYLGPIVERELGMSLAEWGTTGNRYQYYLDPVRNIYLNSRSDFSRGRQGSMTYVIVFIIIAVFILLIACINFMNLTTARAATRAKEIGLRKVVGSFRWQIVRQLLLESILYSLISLFLAIVIVELALPFFSDLIQTSLNLNLQYPYVWGLLIVLSVFVGFIAGVYSAMVISSFRITTVLKGSVFGGKQKSWLRNGLVLLQFSISIFIIICTFIIYYQLKYISQKKLGFEKDQVMVIERVYGLKDKMVTYKEEVGKFPGVMAASITSNVPGTGTNGQVFQKEGDSAKDMIHFRRLSGDYDYLQAMGIELKQGRFFSPEFSGDSLGCVINEAAVKHMGLENPIGTKLYYSGENDYLEVIGVVADYHINSLHEEIPNIMMTPPFSQYSHFLVVRLQTHNIQQTIDQIREKWREFDPNQPFEYFFMDEHFAGLHSAENRAGQIVTIFSILAIFVACLGLYGLAAFTAHQKTKEIGIRKVLGASVGGITGLLMQQFTRWVILANIIAWPVAWFAMKRWLQNYAYAIKIDLRYFIFAGFITLIIAGITVVFQSVKAANANPVKALKYE